MRRALVVAVGSLVLVACNSATHGGFSTGQTSGTGSGGSSPTTGGTSGGCVGTFTLQFTSPTQGQVFNLGSDEEMSTPGLQIPIRLLTNASCGAVQVCSTIAPTSTAMACSGGGFLVGTATVSGGSASIAAATLGDDGMADNQTLTATIPGTSTPAATVTIQVHSVQPIIQSVTVENAFVDSDGGVWLNAANLKSGLAQTTVSVVMAPNDTFLLPDGGGGLVTISPHPFTAPITSNATPAATVPISLSDGTYNFSAVATDAFGNTSASVVFPVLVKTALPSCQLTANYGACFNVSNNGNDAGMGSVLVPLTITSTNAGGPTGTTYEGTAAVTINGGAPSDSALTTSPQQVEIVSTQGGDIFSATVTDPAGNPAADCTPASVSVTVATEGPTLYVVLDAGVGTDGGVEVYASRDDIPISVDTFGIDAGLKISLSITGTGVGGGSTATVYQSVAADGWATFTMSGAPNGQSVVTASGTDACGNPGTGTGVIEVSAPGCDLTFGSPIPIEIGGMDFMSLNATQVNKGTAALVFHTGCPDGTTVSFNFIASDGTVTGAGSLMSEGHIVTFDLTGLADGSTGGLQAFIAGGESLPDVSYSVKLGPPAIGSATPAPGNLLVVAPQNNNLALADAGVAGTVAGTLTLTVDGGTILSSEAQCSANACVDFAADSLTNLGPVDFNGNIGTATLALNFGGGTTNPNPISIAFGQTSVDFSAVSLPAVSYPSPGTVTMTITDTAGNVATKTWNVVTDSLQPAAPTPTAAMTDKRIASATLTWTAQSQGADTPVAGYQLGYSINALNVTPPAACVASCPTIWSFDPGIAGIAGDAGPYTLAGLPTLDQYTFELRAIDAVGNLSPLSPAVTAASLATTANPDPNAWQTVTITDTDTNADFGYVLRSGDFNNDGMQDLVITAPYNYVSGTPGIVYILAGQANLSGLTFANLSAITLGGTASDYFGQDAHVANLNGGKYDDLIVGSPAWDGGQGRVDIFFGSATGLPLTPSVTIFGDSSQDGDFGYSVNAVGDVDGNGTVDLLVGAPGMGSGAGSAYLYLSPAPKGTYPASPTATTIISGNPGDGVGARWGSVPIGDIDGDKLGDFVVGAPGGGGTDGINGGPGFEYGITGALALDAGTIAVGTQATFTLTSRPGGACDPMYFGYASGGGVEYNTFWGCYGVNAIGGVNFTGGNLPDLLVGSDYYSAIYMYSMGASGPTDAPPAQPAFTSEDSAGSLGWSMVATDLNGDKNQDLLVGENSGTPNVFLYLNNSAGTGLSNPVNALNGITALTVPPSGELFGPPASYFGYGLATGDFNGIANNGQDFAVSDPVASYVNIYY